MSPRSCWLAMAVVPVAADRRQQLLPPLSMAIPLTIICVAILAIPPATAQALAFTPEQTGTCGAILTVVPVFVALTALQANLTAVIYLRSQRYHPPARLIDIASGLSSIVGAFLGPAPICLISVLTPLTAGSEAGEPSVRHWSVYVASAMLLLIALGAGVAAQLPALLPLPLLLAIAGLALVGVLAQALGEMVRDPLLLGPLFAFAVASSRLSLLGLGRLFWALVIGTGVSLALEATAPEDPRATALASVEEAREMSGRLSAGSCARFASAAVVS